MPEGVGRSREWGATLDCARRARALILETTLGYDTRMKEPIITASPDVMGGTPVFAGTRVPVQTLLDYLKAGESIDDFLEGFPSVSKEQVIAFLQEAEEQIVKMVV
jgi:uncharacterized protein (DUF433 family)